MINIPDLISVMFICGSVGWIIGRLELISKKLDEVLKK